MATKKKTSRVPSQKEQELNLMKKKALEQFVEHNRDYLKLDLTIPLGNNALKQVHTNQWLWTSMPKEFVLANWSVIAKALNSATNRYEEYVRNRWYIDGVDISVDATGKAEMKLSCNAFSSSHSDYYEEYRELQKAYTDAISNTSKKSSAGKTKSNALANNNKSLINTDWVKKYDVPSIVVEKIKQCCKQGNTEYQNVKAWHEWMDANVAWQDYEDSKKSITSVINDGKGNCVDNSRVFRAGCLALGVKCRYMKGYGCGGYGHQWNKVYFSNGMTKIVDNGRDNASWGSHFGQPCSEGEWETDDSW